MEQVSIDASEFEGGGQIFRNSASLSVIMKKILTMHSIRSNRPVPGLHKQALSVIRVIQSIFGGEWSNSELGCTETVYTPACGNDENLYAKSSTNSKFVEDVGSAGSLTLVMQAILPCLLLCNDDGMEDNSNCKDISLIGGTNVSFSPPIEHFTEVLNPLLFQMGIQVDCQLLKRGFYPVGGGRLQFSVTPMKSSDIRPLTMTSQGSFTSVHIYVYSSLDDVNYLEGTEVFVALKEAEDTLRSSLRQGVCDLLSAAKNSAEDISITFDHSLGQNSMSMLPLPPEVTKSSSSSPVSCKKDETSTKNSEKLYNKNSGKHKRPREKHVNMKNQSKKRKIPITLGALVSIHTDTGCILSANDIMNEKDHKKFDSEMSSDAVSGITTTIMSRLERAVLSEACVDEQTADQLLIYMALAHGTSEILCSPFCQDDFTQHIEAAIHVVTKFTDRNFTVQVIPDTQCRIIRCEDKA